MGLTEFSSLGKGRLASLTFARMTGLTGLVSLVKRQTGFSNLGNGLNGLSSLIKRLVGFSSLGKRGLG